MSTIEATPEASASDISFHYPPELFNLLVDAIPLLNRSKKDVLLFFRGAGVPSGVLGPIDEALKAAPADHNKYAITRGVLEALNARGETNLRERREVLRRVVEFSNFDTCWESDRLKARGLVASIREVVNQKDAFTRMHHERDQERQARLAEVETAKKARQDKQDRIEAVRKDLYALFGEGLTPQTRGKKLEDCLNNLFATYGILVNRAFHTVSSSGEGIVEQVDGVIELKGDVYFVEMKWHRQPVGVPEVSEHLVRLISRAEARGLIVSASDFTGPAVHTARDFLQHKVVVLSSLSEIVRLLENQDDLGDFLNRKVQAAVVHRNPYFKPLG